MANGESKADLYLWVPAEIYCMSFGGLSFWRSAFDSSLWMLQLEMNSIWYQCERVRTIAKSANHSNFVNDRKVAVEIEMLGWSMGDGFP